MSTSYTELIQNLTRADEARDREEMSRESEPAPYPTAATGAAAALLANAGEIDYTVTPTPAYLSDAQLEVQGCQFIDAVNYFLEYLSCPPDVRHLVLAICGLSGGDYANYSEMDQKLIGQRMGLDPRNVRERLHALYKWEQAQDRAVVQVEEQDRAGGSVKFGTTRYRPVVVYYAAEFVRRLKARGLRPVHRQRSLNPATEAVFEQIAQDVAEDMPNADIRRRERKERDVTPKQSRMRFLEEREQSFYRAATALRDALKQSGYNPLERGDEYYAKLVAIFSE